ncbi:hypothetical protein L0128_22930, partial [candidate division KSB1 bacterium]|nr:hypothetical protein [candidate division KSB1 bacterium]
MLKNNLEVGITSIYNYPRMDRMRLFRIIMAIMAMIPLIRPDMEIIESEEVDTKRTALSCS